MKWVYHQLILLLCRYVQQDTASARTRDVCHILVRRQGCYNSLRRLDLPQRHKCFPVLLQRLRDGRGSLGLTLGTDDRRLPLLLRLLDDELCPLRILLGNLLGLDGLCEFLNEKSIRIHQ